MASKRAERASPTTTTSELHVTHHDDHERDTMDVAGDITDTDLRPHRGSLALLCAVNFMVIMDAQIVILALPSIKSALGFGEDSVQWVLSVYLLCFGGLLLLGGRAGDLLGRRRVLLVGTALFGLSSLACGAAWVPAVLVAARAVQGISAALMAPTALSILTSTWPEGAPRNKALAAWGGVGGVGATAALLVGGGLTSALGWEWIFWINAPVSVALLVLVPKVLPDSRAETRSRSFDIVGALTLTAGLTAVIYAIVDAPTARSLTGNLSLVSGRRRSVIV